MAVLESHAFETSTANEIFARFAGRDDQCPDDLLDFVYGQILALAIDRYRKMDVQEAMQRVSISHEI
ncbi:hypothetical protein PHISCL_01492 [Aspergillus sclerotialis]|uniref:Uncharacterized protein n=1 Tax=Aspergillus sclerotialis TaxID=2070753 RepID=A0A3A2ZSL6_9EURO|nr:hypothetical protein PHISCL_01492 [Aspergillus sclerotialis]